MPKYDLSDEQIKAAWGRTQALNGGGIWMPLTRIISEKYLRIKPEPREVWVAEGSDTAFTSLEDAMRIYGQTSLGIRRYREVIE